MLIAKKTGSELESGYLFLLLRMFCTWDADSGKGSAGSGTRNCAGKQNLSREYQPDRQALPYVGGAGSKL